MIAVRFVIQRAYTEHVSLKIEIKSMAQEHVYVIGLCQKICDFGVILFDAVVFELWGRRDIGIPERLYDIRIPADPGLVAIVVTAYNLRQLTNSNVNIRKPTPIIYSPKRPNLLKGRR